TFAKVWGAGSFILPLNSRFTVHLRAEAATTFRDDKFSEIPVSMRFFVGGDSSVRGYSYDSRGPRNKDGDVIGGDSKLVGSAEVEYALNDNWGLAVFYDTGSAFNAVNKDIKYINGAGVGVRRYTLIGPIKIDLASRVGDSKNRLRVHLSVGFDI
ncbi:MAG: BamA/TamA family outer membrane protein, partial [Candidatus Marinimicrobia bacterium]|nr:BamA/TamA family outer membrane protein [Candidatus Neomarinimicrobiota bacterium]